MNEKDRNDIIQILQEIRNKSTLAVKGGSGGAVRYAMRDPHIIWELGVALENSIVNISKERKDQTIRSISRKLDNEILGKDNEWCISAYDWKTNFQTKEHFLFVCRLAGYRENDEQNRFNKRRVRYLRPIYTVKEESTFTQSQIQRLTKALQENSTLELNDSEYYDIIKKIRGKEKIQWQYSILAIEDLIGLVENAIEDRENVENRTTLRENLGEVLIKQIRYALQLCVIDNKKDFEYASSKAREIFTKKAKTNYPMFQKLFENLKVLLKDFNEKSQKVKKERYYELILLNSNLDAISNEEIYHEYMKRKDTIGEVFG